MSDRKSIYYTYKTIQAWEQHDAAVRKWGQGQFSTAFLLLTRLVGSFKMTLELTSGSATELFLQPAIPPKYLAASPVTTDAIDKVKKLDEDIVVEEIDVD
ncbi:hypothetical protein N8T08_003263 [Aspergillus melleus]|uniref:Uncharacterized protein n=1 Tax=Aspergillus melleus TaxID=138277 RepID=A0ACC3B791_9EURO|nr:hypothetical protein N8T08_003263 [Aspergillus melleus]